MSVLQACETKGVIVPQNLTLLVVSADPKAPADIEAALAGLSVEPPIVHYAPDAIQGAEAARSRRPDLLVAEMTKDLAALKYLASEVTVGSPETILAAMFHPSVFGVDVSESAVMIEALRAGFRDFLRRPISSSDLEQLLQRLGRPVSSAKINAGTIVTFLSNKGGVGKSTLAVNVAAGLAKKHSGHVLLVDASLQMGVCASLLDLRPANNLVDTVRQKQRLDESLLRRLVERHESGLDLLAAPNDAIDAREVDDESLARVLTLARRTYRYVVVDSFPLLDRVMMAVLDLSDRIFTVVESVVPTVLGAAKLLHLLDSLAVPRAKQAVIVNRFTGDTSNLGVRDVSARLDRPIDHVVPYDRNVVVAGNVGNPLVGRAGIWPSRWHRAMQDLIREIESMPSVSQEGRP